MKAWIDSERELCRRIAEAVGHPTYAVEFGNAPDGPSVLLSLEDAIEEMERRGFRVAVADGGAYWICDCYQKNDVATDFHTYGATHREAALKCLLKIVESEEGR